MHAVIKGPAIRRVEHRAETYSNESQHLAEGTEVAHLRRRFSFVLQQALSFRTRHHLCRQGVALASTRQLRSQGPVSVHAHHTEGVTEPKGREGANGVRGGIGVGDGNGDGIGGGNGDANGAGAGTATGVEANEGAKDGTGAGTGAGTGTRAVAEMGTGTRMRGREREWDQEGRRTGEEAQETHKNCRRDQALLFRTRHHLYTADRE